MTIAAVQVSVRKVQVRSKEMGIKQLITRAGHVGEMVPGQLGHSRPSQTRIVALDVHSFQTNRFLCLVQNPFARNKRTHRKFRNDFPVCACISKKGRMKLVSVLLARVCVAASVSKKRPNRCCYEWLSQRSATNEYLFMFAQISRTV